MPEAAIGKRNNPANDNGNIIYNELICYQIGRALNLPIPDGNVDHPPAAEPFFWQLNFEPGKHRRPPVNPSDVLARFPAEAYRLLAFDILVVNTDRHRKNLTLIDGGGQLVVFDHSHALIGGRFHKPGLHRLQGNALRQMGCDGRMGGKRHCLLDIVDDAVELEKAVKETMQLSDPVIGDAVRAAVGHGMSNAEASVVRDAIRRRRDTLDVIVETNRGQFSNIHQWALGIL